MSQYRYTKATRRSDLQPVYDLIDALQPRKLRATFLSVDRRVRWITIIGVAFLVLLWVTTTLTQTVIRHMQMNRGAAFTEALNAPYGLENHLVPMLPTPNTNILPGTVGEFSGSANPVQIMLTAEQAANQEAPVIYPTPVSAVSSQIGECLFSSVDGDTPENCIGYTATFATTSDYYNNAHSIVNMTMALFSDHEQAGRVVRTLQQKANTIGRVGNYAMGISSVDYFFSSQSGLYTLSWANGPWVYTAASPSFDALEKFATQFPY